MKRTFNIVRLLFLAVLCTAADIAFAQTVLTLQDCRELALKNNKASSIAREKVNAATYDRKAALSNYFPKLSVSGAYLHNSDNISLLNDNDMSALTGLGTNLNSQVQAISGQLMHDPEFLMVLLLDPGMRYVLEKLQGVDIEGPLNAIGSSVADKFTFDIANTYIGTVTLEEPLYAGGKIRAYNKVTSYARELAETQLEGEDRKVQVTADEAYWQIVSIANKLKLADKYVELLRKLDKDINAMKEQGVVTASDQLSVKVKLNEAEMIQIKAQNGLSLSKMLLCQLCGLDLHSDITLADEEEVGVLTFEDKLEYTEKDIDENRPELKSLQLAVQMYDQKTRIVQADYLPTLALMGNYMMTNPNVKHGFENKFSGMWSVGVVARIPVFHFGEGINKVRRAKSDALIAQYQLDEARGKITLQVTQYEQKIKEAESRLQMAEKNMENADENLRIANIGFQEGVLESTVVMQAQTAWMQAHSEDIDARIDRIMANVYLRQATGMWNK